MLSVSAFHDAIFSSVYPRSLVWEEKNIFLICQLDDLSAECQRQYDEKGLSLKKTGRTVHCPGLSEVHYIIIESQQSESVRNTFISYKIKDECTNDVP